MPTYPHIEQYRAHLQQLKDFGGSDNELNIRPAFQNCLDAYCREHREKLGLVPELSVGNVVPDGTVKDSLRMARGYWEAKDTDYHPDPTIAEKFNTYRFADYKERVIDLLQRVCAASVGTMDVVDDMAYWDDEGRLVVYGDRDELEWSMLGLHAKARHDEEEDPEWLAGWSET